MKQFVTQRSVLIGAALVTLLAFSIGGYARVLSQRQHTIAQLDAELAEVPPRPQHAELLAEVAGLSQSLDALRTNETAPHLRRCSQAMENAGLTHRSVTTHEPEHRDGLVLTPIRFRAHGSVDAVFGVLRSEPFSRDGVLVERFSMALLDSGTHEDLCFELDMVLVRPE